MYCSHDWLPLAISTKQSDTCNFVGLGILNKTKSRYWYILWAYFWSIYMKCPIQYVVMWHKILQRFLVCTYMSYYKLCRFKMNLVRLRWPHSVFWHCWLNQQACKNILSKMTSNVSSVEWDIKHYTTNHYCNDLIFVLICMIIRRYKDTRLCSVY